MSVELSIMKLFCDSREIESTHFGYIKAVANMEKEIKLLFNLIDSYYKDYENGNITKDDLISYYEIKYPKAKERNMHLDLISSAFTLDVNPDLVKISLDQLVEKHTVTTIVNKLIPVMEGEKYGVLESIRGDIDSFIDLLYNPPDSLVVPEPCRMTTQELIEQEIMDDGIPWHIRSVTNIVNGIRRKTLGLIYAFVDSGKTSFAFGACAAFAKFLTDDQNICYAGNEEDAPRMRLRFIQALLNKTRGQIACDGDEADRMAIERGLNRVNIFDSITTGEQLQYIIKEYQPTILFIDQATDIEIQTGRKREGVDYLKALFKWYRRLANKHDCAIVGVSQGVGLAENTQWLKLSDIYGSRVAIQGALDYAIGIGRKVDDPVSEDLRFINIPKNKLHDGEGGKFIVNFHRQTCLWREV